MKHDREFVGFECDHLRPLVKVDGKWHHVDKHDGTVLGECSAGAYRIEAVYRGEHYICDPVVEMREDGATDG